MLHVLLGILVFLAVVWITKNILQRFDPKRPPGPWGLPILGYSPFLGNSHHEEYCKLANKYGPVFGFYYGSVYTVILGDYASIKEAYNKEEFLDRPVLFQHVVNDESIVSMNGWQWKETRRFVLSTFRTLGMGKNKVEERIKDEISVDLEALEKAGSEAEVNTQDFFYRAFANNIFSIINGLKFEDSNKSLSMLKTFKTDALSAGYVAFLSMYFPIAKAYYTVLNLFGVSTARTDLVDNYLTQEMQQHEKNFDPDHKEDFIDYYLDEMKKNQKKDTSLTVANMFGNAKALLIAGVETTQITLDWMFLCLAKYPDVQEKIYREIVDHLGKEKPPSWNDKDTLLYTYAFTMEVQRAHTIAPASDPHFSGRAGTVAGYHIPEGSVILANVYAVHNDKKLWGDPENFRPERFISSEGKLVTPEYWMPFLIGKRMCPGEKLAIMQIFLFVTSVVQKFRVVPPRSGLSLEGRYEFMYYAQKPIVSFHRRA